MNPTRTMMMLLQLVPSRSGFDKSTHYVRKAKNDHAKVNYGRLAKCRVRDKKW